MSDVAPLLSLLAADPGLRPLVEEFVGELPSRLAEIGRVLEAGDLARTVVLAHQLKGAAGGYGFPEIGDAAQQLEEAALAGTDGAAIRARLDALGTLCGRARVS